MLLKGSMLLLFLFVSQVTADAIDPCDDGTMMPKKDDSFPKVNDICGCGPVNENYDANGNAAAQLMSTLCNAGTTCTVATKSCTCTPDADHFCYYSKGPATVGYTLTYTAKFGCYPHVWRQNRWIKYSCIAIGTEDVVQTDHSAAGCADDTVIKMLGTTDTMKFTYTKIYQDFSVPDDGGGGSSNVNQQRKATSYCKDGTSTPPPRANCSDISGPLAWCKTADAKKFTNGLISDGQGVPVVGLTCKADPCTPADDGATCCQDTSGSPGAAAPGPAAPGPAGDTEFDAGSVAQCSTLAMLMVVAAMWAGRN